MQTTLLGLAIAFILALVAALVGPHFIDWNQFRPQFEAEASRVVGAPVRVRGALDARLLPSPSLRLQSITVGGANDLGRIRADKLDVEFSLSSLMRGEWRATELSIDGAAVDLGLDAKGRVDLPAATGPFNLGALAIDRLNVTGRIALHDAASRTTLELNDIAFSGDVRSLAAGALRGDGNAMLWGVRYPFRISSGQTNDGSGTRFRLTVDPAEKPLSVDFDGILNFDNRVPRFDGAVTVARPPASKGDKGDRGMPPWRVSAKLKADPAAARMEAVEASFGADESALKLNGVADMAFGASPLLHAVLSAKQLDLDRAAGRDTATDPAGPLPALRQLLSAIPRPAVATRLEISAEQITLGGRPVQDVAAHLRRDTGAWTVDHLEFRAPGATRVTLGESAAQATPDAFRGTLSIDSADPDTLATWLQGRGEVSLRNTRPLQIKGQLDASGDRITLDDLKAEVDGGKLQGRIVYVYASTSGGSQVDAELKGDRLDIDAAVALVRSLAGPQGEWPAAGRLSLDIDRAISAGQELHPLVARLGYDPRTFSLDRFTVGNATGLMLEGSGALDRSDTTGRLAITASAAGLGQIATAIAPLAPSFAARLNAIPPSSDPVHAKLSLEVTKDPERSDHVAARGIVDIDASQLTGQVTLNANPTLAALRGADLEALSHSEISAESKLDGPGKQLLAVLRLGDAVAASDAPVSFEGSLSGSFKSPLRIKAKLSGADIDADVKGSAEPWAAPAKAALTLAIRRANLAPLFGLKADDAAADNMALSSRVALNGEKLSFEDIDSTVAGARLRGRIALGIGAEKTIDGQLGMDTIEVAPAFALVLGTRGRDNTEPLGRGLLQGWRGQLAVQALTGALPGGAEIRPFSSVVKSDGQSLTIDAINGNLGGGPLTGDIDIKPGLAGYTLGARIQLTGADAAALRYRSLALPAGKASLRLTLSSQGRSASALAAAISGSGLLTLDGAQISGLDPRVFDIALRASDAGQAGDDAKLRQIVEPALASGTWPIASAQIPFSIKDSRLRIDATTLDGDGARVILSGGYDIVADQADLRATLSATATNSSSARPEIQIFATGTPDKLTRSVDVASLSSWLAIRAIDRETRRLDALERSDGAHAGIPAVVPPAVPTSAPSVPADLPAASAPGQPSIPLPGADPRRTTRPSLSRPVGAAANAPPPAASQQVAPLPAPIEVRPAPGGTRMTKPRPSAPLVLTPQAPTQRPAF